MMNENNVTQALPPFARGVRGDVIDINQKLGVGIRKMDFEDLESVYEIETKCFADPWKMVSFEESLMSSECLVLYKGKPIGDWHYGPTLMSIGTIDGTVGTIMGFFIGMGSIDEYTICNVAILPEYQGRGFGFYFVSSIIQNHHQRYEKYILEVRKSNAGAIALYEKIGFKPSYERKKYYQNPLEDAVVMVYEHMLFSLDNKKIVEILDK